MLLSGLWQNNILNIYYLEWIFVLSSFFILLKFLRAQVQKHKKKDAEKMLMSMIVA